MANSDPFVLEFEYPTGQPEDLWIARDQNWIGIAVGFQRAQSDEARALSAPDGGRKFLDRAGVYLLRGKDPRTGSVLLRVGEGGTVSTRIQSHDLNLPWWLEAVAVVSGGDGWDSGQIKHFEAELYRRAVDAKRCVLMNGNQPQGGNLSGAKKTSANSLVDEIVRRLRAAGYPEFQAADEKKPSRAARTKKRKNPPIPVTTPRVPTPSQNQGWPAGAEVSINRKGVIAYARRGRGKRLIVLEGSRAAGTRTTRCPTSVINERRRIWGQAAEGSDAPLRFERDRTFETPSAAAGVVLGYAVNGNVEWRSPDGTALRDLKHR